LVQSATLPNPCLALITSRHLCTSLSLSQIIRAAIAGGVNLVQLREKDLGTTELHRLAFEIREITLGRALFFINGERTLAKECQADGVHFPEQELIKHRNYTNPSTDFLIGQSVHSLSFAQTAEEHHVSYVQLGTIFPSKSKPSFAGSGTELIRSVSSNIKTPIIAVGGINISNVRAVSQSGATGIAVISAIMEAKDPQKAAYELREVLETPQKST
tara:strand:- start:1824 stop:2471 length:648 start_codon:yes stop_codon:yes gene_type:complete